MRILYITSHYNPFVPHTGSDQRYNLLLNALVRIGQVDVITFANGVESAIDNCKVVFSENIPAIAQEGRWNRFKRLLHPQTPYSYFPVNTHRATIAGNIIEQGNYDLIVTRYVDCAYECDLMRYADKLVIDVDDSPIDVWMTLSHNAVSKRAVWYYKICAVFIKRILPCILKKIRHSFFPNAEQLIGENATYLPNIPYYEMQELERKEIRNNQIIFVGDLRYTPNYLGVEHFVEYIFPKIQETIPQVQLILVGRNKGEEWANRMQMTKGVHVLGFVDNLQELYTQSNVCVVPVYSGAGTNIKVLEALQAGRACVVTKEATRGFASVFRNGKDYYVAHDDDEFAKYVIDLLNDDNCNRTLAEHGAQTVRAYYSRETFNGIVKRSLVQKSITFFMLVTPRDAIIAEYAIRSFLKLRKVLQNYDWKLQVYMNCLEDAQKERMHQLESSFDYLELVDNSEYIKKEDIIPRQKVLFEGISTRPYEGKYEIGCVVWEREFRKMNTDYWCIVDADFEILKPEFVKYAFEQLERHSDLYIYSTDGSNEETKVYNTYTGEDVLSKPRCDTWFCIFKRECLRCITPLYYHEVIHNGEKWVWDDTGKFQEDLQRSGDCKCDYIDIMKPEELRNKYVYQYIHYGAFSKNVSIKTMRDVRSYRRRILAARNGILYLDRNSIINKFIRYVYRIIVNKKYKQISLERQQYHNE